MVFGSPAQSEFHALRERTHLSAWLALFAFLTGLLVLGSEASHLVPIFMAVGYLAILAGFSTAMVVSRDIFNPLCVVLIIGLFRYSCPAVLLLLGVEPSEEISHFYRLMGLSDSEWLWAHVLALTSLAGIVLGWFLVHTGSFKASRLNFSFNAGLSHAALLGMLVGGAALTVFVVKNASLAALVTGAVRHATVQEGTGVYFRFIYMAIGSSILLSAYLLGKKKTSVALMPVFLCSLVLTTLGGRGRAIIPLAAGLLLCWYRNREQKGWRTFSFNAKYLFAAVCTFILGTWFFHFVALYRGGGGLSALTQSLSLSGIWDYLSYSIFIEFGNLHSLGGALVIGPGVLAGHTFLGVLTFPLSKLLPIPGRSAGTYIIETLLGFQTEDRWALHAGLIGDAYLNFGMLGIVMIMPMFGVLIKIGYAKFRSGKLNAAIYAFAATYGINLFLKSIDAWPNMLVGLVFMVMIIGLGRLLILRRSAPVYFGERAKIPS